MLKLYVVDGLPSSPEDVTLRMARVLHTAAFVVSGDVVSLRALGFEAPVVELPGDLAGQESALLCALEQGPGVLVCDPGMVRTWGDGRLPHALLVRGVTLESVPGPSNEITAVVASGLPMSRVTLLGTLPLVADKRLALLRGLEANDGTLVCRVPAGLLDTALGEVESVLGRRRVAVASSGQVQRMMAEDGVEQVTEACDLVIEALSPATAWTERRVRERAESLLCDGHTARDIAQELSRLSGWSRRKVYALVLDVCGDR